MKNCIGLRKENKDLSERRVALTPSQVKNLVDYYGVRVHVEPSDSRVFEDHEYEEAGALVTPDLRDCNVIFGVKEIPVKNLSHRQAYCFFSHTIKAQPYNMPMLAHIVNDEITLLDYERVRDEEGRRQIFFGNYAGYAGMIDSLWALGQRLRWEGMDTPFEEVQPAYRYDNLRQAEEAIREVGIQIQKMGLPRELGPMICGFSGYGQVSRGAQKIFDLLPVISLTPEELSAFIESDTFSSEAVYKVEFHEHHMFAPNGIGDEFDLQDYFSHPEKYHGIFEQYIPYLTVLINGIYWEPTCPRLLTRAFLAEHYRETERPALRVIGDISCDIEGSIEMTVKATNSDNPIYVYDPLTDRIADGWKGRGTVIMAVDKLPAELPREASAAFGEALLPFVPMLASADFAVSLEALKLAPEFKRAVIAHAGELAPAFKYLHTHIDRL